MKVEKLEQVAKEHLIKQEMAKEIKADLKDLIDEVEVIMAQNDLSIYSFEVGDEEKRIVTLRRRNKEQEKLDKDGLAIDLEVEKKDLNTKGMVKLAEEGKLTEQLITDHTFKNRKTEVKMRVRKQREKKGNQKQGEDL